MSSFGGNKSEFRQWFDSLPPVTKYLGIISAILPLAMKLNIFPPSLLVFHWPSISRKFQLWRLFTPLFITRPSVFFIFGLFFRCQYSYQLETINFAGRSADYLFFLLASTLALNAVNIYFGMAALWESFSMIIIYLWAQYNRSTPVSFLFGIRFPAIYLPVAMAIFAFATDGDIIGTLCGIVVGHLWFVLREVYGARNPRIQRLLEAPKFMKRLVDGPKGGSGYSALRQQSAAGTGFKRESPSTDTFRPFHGKSQRLGD